MTLTQGKPKGAEQKHRVTPASSQVNKVRLSRNYRKSQSVEAIQRKQPAHGNYSVLSFVRFLQCFQHTGTLHDLQRHTNTH